LGQDEEDEAEEEGGDEDNVDDEDYEPHEGGGVMGTVMSNFLGMHRAQKCGIKL